MNWNEEHIIQGEKQTPTNFLVHHYTDLFDSQIAEILENETGQPVSKNAVRKKRTKLNLYKDGRNGGEVKSTEPVFEEEGNYGNAKCSTSTLADLIDICGIDTDIWTATKFKPWFGFAKVDGDIQRVPLASAEFVRKEPVEVSPTIHSIHCDVEFDAPVMNTNQEVTTELVFSDPHFGYRRKEMYCDKLISFHDKRVLKILLKICRLVKPSVVRMLGDIFDFPEFTDRFARSPEFAYLTQPAINDAYAFIKKVREILPNSRIIVSEGNHDSRMRNMIAKHLPYAFGLKAADELELPSQLSVPRLLALHKLSVEYVDGYPNDFSVSDNGLVEYSHGETARSKPYSTVKNIVENSDITRCVGHIHRRECASRTIWRGGQHRIISAHSFGCVCKIDGTVPGKTKRQNWQQGFGIIYHTPTQSQITPYEIDSGCCITPWGVIEVNESHSN